MSGPPPDGSVPASALLPTAGWFGKIPALGDFASRRLPAEFIEAWDIWLSLELCSAREKLGENWLESYLNAPIWRFALMPGALDAHAWFGVLMPSVDRVGRQFPLTFAASFVPEPEALHRWWSNLIGVAMRAKERDCDANALEAALLASKGDAHPVQSLESFEARVAPSLVAAAAGTSLWWSCERREAPGDDTLSVLEGLPRGDRFVQLMAPGRG